MNKKEALNYLKSSGLTDDQIREIEQAFTPKRIIYSGVNDLRDRILVKTPMPDIPFMRKDLDDLISQVFEASLNENLVYVEDYPKQIYQYFFDNIHYNIELIQDDLYRFIASILDDADDVKALQIDIDIHTKNLKRFLKQLDIIAFAGMAELEDTGA